MRNRVVQPMNESAANAADEALYEQHRGDSRPNALYDEAGNRKPLDPEDPDQSRLQGEWVELYEQSGGEVETASGPRTRPDETAEPCPFVIEFRVIDEDCEFVEVREPLEYRVYDESESIVQEGTWDGNTTIRVYGDPTCRYALWIDGEYVTFHEGQEG